MFYRKLMKIGAFFFFQIVKHPPPLEKNSCMRASFLYAPFFFFFFTLEHSKFETIYGDVRFIRTLSEALLRLTEMSIICREAEGWTFLSECDARIAALAIPLWRQRPSWILTILYISLKEVSDVEIEDITENTARVRGHSLSREVYSLILSIDYITDVRRRCRNLWRHRQLGCYISSWFRPNRHCVSFRFVS